MVSEPETRQAFGAPNIIHDLRRVEDGHMPVVFVHAGKHIIDEYGRIAVRIAGGYQHTLFIFREIPQARQGMGAQAVQHIHQQALQFIGLRNVDTLQINPAFEHIHRTHAVEPVNIFVDQRRVSLSGVGHALCHIKRKGRGQAQAMPVKHHSRMLTGRIAPGI